MYEVSKFSSENRQMYCTCRIAGGNVAKDYIKSVTLSESAVTNDSIMMGTTNSSTIELELVNITSTIKNRIKKGAVVVPVIYVSDDDFVTPQSISLGKFYIDEVTFTEGYNGASTNASITAYDGFYLTEKEYTPPALENATIRSLVTDICNNQVSSLVMDTNAWSNTIKITSVPTGITVRNMLGYLAGLQGCIATFTRTGNLTARWYTPCSKVITAAEQYLSGFENESLEDSTIKYLESGTQDGVLVAGESGVIGTAISFENPMMTQELLNSIYSSKIKVGNNYSITYRPCSVKWRGDPTIELCEIVQVEGADGNNLNLYVMERELSFDGGLYETYKCCIPSETTIAFSKNATMQKLDRKLTNLENSIKKATDVITQTEGSVFEFVSANNPENPSQNSGWKLHSTINNNVILAKSSGIGFSTNGGESFDAASIYMDETGGHIVATDIVAGSVTTDKIAIGTSEDPNSLTKYINDVSNKVDSSLQYTEIPHFVSNGGTADTGRMGCYIDKKYSDSFKIQRGTIINVTFSVSAKTGSKTGAKYLRLYTNYKGSEKYTYVNDGTCVIKPDPSATYIDESCEIKIYKDGNQVFINSGDVLWGAGETVTFAYDGKNWSMTDTKYTSRAEAESILSQNAEKQLINTYGICDTPSSTYRKYVDIDLGGKRTYEDLVIGEKILVYFAYASGSSAPYLNLNNWSSVGYPIVSESGSAASWTNCSTRVLMWTGSKWQVTTDYTTAMDIAKKCLDTNSSFIDGSRIYAGSITAASCNVGNLQAAIVNADLIKTGKLDVGHGYKSEIFKNPDCSSNMDGWVCYGGSLRYYSDRQNIYFVGGTSTNSVSSVTQYVYLEHGKTYHIAARIGITNAYSVTSGACIGFILGNGTWGTSNGRITSSIMQDCNEKYTTIDGSAKFDGSTGVYDVGVYIKGVRASNGNNASYWVNWMSLTETNDLASGSYFRASRSTWSDYLITDTSNRMSTLYSIGLTISNDGSLSTVSSVNSTSGRIGALAYDTTGTNFPGLWADQYGNQLAFSTVQLVSPNDDLYYPRFDTDDNVPIFAPIYSHIYLKGNISPYDNAGHTSGFDDNYRYNLITPEGIYCYEYTKTDNGSGGYDIRTRACQMSPKGANADNFIVHSQESIKENIVETESTLNKLKASKVYTYNLKSDGEDANTKVGFVVERETPDEIISDDGKGINLYSMASMNWKATQELLERLEKLESKVNGTETTEEIDRDSASKGTVDE